MKDLGMIVRADFGRGLANQTYSFYKHLQPEVTVAIDMSPLDPKGKWPQDFTKYPDAIVTRWGGYTAPFENPDALKALQECDIIYTAETHYDERLQEMPSILHVNPEFFRNQKATQYWYPTVWRIDELPLGEIVPTPIERVADEVAGPGAFLHVGGHRTWGDRNGSQIVHGALRRVPKPWKVTSQDGFRLHPHAMQYVKPVGYVEDRWSLYDDAAVLVYPRRYGGQSLQVNEAMSRGLAVIMSDISPNIETWPVIPIAAKRHAHVQTPGGRMPTYAVNVNELAELLNALTDSQVDLWQHKSLEWAQANSWDVWYPGIEALIG